MKAAAETLVVCWCVAREHNEHCPPWQGIHHGQSGSQLPGSHEIPTQMEGYTEVQRCPSFYLLHVCGSDIGQFRAIDLLAVLVSIPTKTFMNMTATKVFLSPSWGSEISGMPGNSIKFFLEHILLGAHLTWLI